MGRLAILFISILTAGIFRRGRAADRRGGPPDSSGRSGDQPAGPGKAAEKDCRHCAKAIGMSATVCPYCRYHQDWRGHVPISGMGVALVVAAISVATTFFGTVAPMLRDKGAAMRFLFEGSHLDGATFLVRNSGTEGGTVRPLSLSIAKNDSRVTEGGLEAVEFFSYFLAQARYIAPATELVLEISPLNAFNIDVCRELAISGYFRQFVSFTMADFDRERAFGIERDDEELRVRLLSGLSCVFSFAISDFNDSVRTVAHEIPCADLALMGDCSYQVMRAIGP